MTHVNGICQFCNKPLTLEIDESYDAVGDPFKLIPLAACNRCSDLRTKRRILVEAMRSVMIILLMDKSVKTRDTAREGLDLLTKKYVKLVSEWTDRELAWETGIVEALLHRPDDLMKTLSRIWPKDINQQALMME